MDLMPNAVKREWVTCPICSSTDMRREEDADGNALILCVNHACASNGGDNCDGLNHALSDRLEDLAAFEVFVQRFGNYRKAYNESKL